MKTTVACVVDLITTDEDKKYELAARMADAIIAISLKQGDCAPQDMKAVGFSPKEVTAQWHMAYSLAIVELKRMKNETISIIELGVRYA